MSGKIVTIFPSGSVVTEEWESSHLPSCERLQEAVGGYFERVRVRYEGKMRDAFVNENGIALGLPENLPATRMLDGRFKGYAGLLHGKCAVWIPNPRKAK